MYKDKNSYFNEQVDSDENLVKANKHFDSGAKMVIEIMTAYQDGDISTEEFDGIQICINEARRKLRSTLVMDGRDEELRVLREKIKTCQRYTFLEAAEISHRKFLETSHDGRKTSEFSKGITKCAYDLADALRKKAEKG